MINQLLGSTGIYYQEYNIRSLPISEVQEYRSIRVQEYNSLGAPDVW